MRHVLVLKSGSNQIHLRTEFCIKRDDPESVLVLNSICSVVRPGLLRTLGVDPPFEFPQCSEVLVIPENIKSHMLVVSCM